MSASVVRKCLAMYCGDLPWWYKRHTKMVSNCGLTCMVILLVKWERILSEVYGRALTIWKDLLIKSQVCCAWPRLLTVTSIVAPVLGTLKKIEYMVLLLVCCATCWWERARLDTKLNSLEASPSRLLACNTSKELSLLCFGQWLD